MVFLLGLATTLLAYVVFDRTFHAHSHETFTRRVEDIARHIEDRLQDDAQLLRTTAGFFQAMENVTRDDWQTYVDSLRLPEHTSDILGLGFAEWIPAEGLPAHLQRIRDDGFPDYEVKPPGERPVYTSVVFLDPFDARNRRAFGYDMYTDPTRRAAMDRAVETESPPGSGAVFHIHLPAVDVQRAASVARTAAARGPQGHGETVLLAEDETAVLRLCEQFLRRLGYRVLPANSAEEAERLAVEHAADIRLLMTDLFMSGYAPETIRSHGVRGRMTFIQKPFDLKTLAARVRAALEGETGVWR